jgi:hydrogenase expression/formation protein HypE
MMRDLTRGGLGSALNEISSSTKKGFDIDLTKLPVQHEVKMASDMLGINPIYLANEGNICIFCDNSISSKLLDILHENKYTKMARIIGKVSKTRESRVLGKNKDGEIEEIEYLYGKELARLC